MGARSLAFPVFLALLAGPCFAQVTGRITGSVTDSSGLPIPNATVNLLLAGGTKALLTTVTTPEGLYSFTNVRPEIYDMTVESSGFLKYSLRGVRVDPARETSLPKVQLEVASVTQSIDVTADVQTVQTSNSEVATTVTNEQIRRLPTLDRDPMSHITTQAGVSSGNGDVVINGTRTSFSNVTLDGINIQDNFLRANGLTYQPNLLLMDQVSEFTISTSNTNATVGGGSSQITLTTPSGGNVYHGAAYWYNRNNALASGNWFDNKDGISKAFLNQNQLGGSLGGHIIKDKLFFYTNYEAFRNRQHIPADRTILTDNARKGIFTYRDRTTGAARQVNVLSLAGEKIDPIIQGLIGQIPGPERINNFRSGDSSPSLLRNTAGYSFSARDNRTKDNVTIRGDYNLSTRHAFATSYLWNRDIADRPDASNDFSVAPKMINTNHSHFLSSSWRWNPGARFVNEVRGGFNLAPGDFVTSEKFGSILIGGLVFSNPVNTAQNEGRATNTYNYADNATYIRGRHTIQFGFQSQRVRIRSFYDAGTIPTYFLGAGDGQNPLPARLLPGVSATDLDSANNLLATLAGWVDAYTQTFNITSRTSGYVDGAPFTRNYSFDNYAGYVHDAWKISPRLTATLGLRYEYFTVLNERDSLELIPRLNNGGLISTLLSDATLDFAGKSVGRPFYNTDRNNFAPNIGLAWDVFGTGKTAVRAGYSVHFVNDETIAAVLNNIESPNQGLQATPSDFALSGTLSVDRPKIPKPVFKVPLKQSENYSLDPTSALGIPDPNLRTPYVQAWTVGIQHEIKNTIFDLRYVANHAVKSFRAFDYNQVIIRENGFLDDFKRAYSNGNLSRASTGVFDPRFNAAVPGSQRLPIFDQISSPELGLTRGGLNHPFLSGLVEQGRAGELAYQYQLNAFISPIDFFRNPVALGTNTITNFSNSSYNSLQFEVRRRVGALNFQTNYTFSKVLSDAAGTTSIRFEPFLDFAGAKNERARAPFDLTHQIKANWIYDIPMGKGHRLTSRRLNALMSGWSLSSVMTWQSGSPFSITSGRGTLNRDSRSAGNTAITPLNKSELDKVIGFRMTGDGPYFADRSIIGPDGRAVAADGAKPFAGQIFFNPGPGEIGSLQRRIFSGPWVFDMSAGVQKMTHITEKHTVEFRMEAGNVFNHPTFYTTGFNINSTQFGKIGDTFTDRRVIQFGLYYRF